MEDRGSGRGYSRGQTSGSGQGSRGRGSRPVDATRGPRAGEASRGPSRGPRGGGPSRGPRGGEGDRGQRPQEEKVSIPSASARRGEQIRSGPSSHVVSSGVRQPGPMASVPRHGTPIGVHGDGQGEHPHRSTDYPIKEQSTAVKGAAGGDNLRGVMRGKRIIKEIIKTRPAKLATKKGVSGTEVSLQTNYFRINKKPEWALNQYRVDFSPDIEYERVRKGLLSEHRNLFDGYLFDGTLLFTAKKFDTTLELVSKNREGEPYKITIKFVGVVEMHDYQYIQILNLILRRSMEGLKLQLVGRNFFDAVAKIDLSQYQIQLWPGYLTSIRQHEQDILMCAEIIHKVMRTDTVYDILQNCVNDSRNYQEAFKKEVIGMIVLTSYNNKTYRVDDIDFCSTPNSTFDTKDGGKLSYIDYYKQRYQLRIRDANQPLLVSRPKERDIRGGQAQLIMLVPELCRATGLNDSMRNNTRLTKDMSVHTRLNPRMRIERLKTFNRRLQTNEDSCATLQSWQFGLDQSLVEMSGRILKQEVIVFGNNSRVQIGKEADWTNEFRKNAMYSIVNLMKWYVVVPSRNRREAGDFIKFVIQAAKGMNMLIKEPLYFVLDDDRNQSYIGALEKVAREDPQLIFAVVPNDNAERYSCIKKKLCVDRSIPSQVITSRNTIPKKGKPPTSLLSVATKVAIQMNCKIMGAPWMIELPLSGLMTVGFDVCHSTRNPAKSYGALVATMDLKKSTRFFSTVSEHNKGQELSNEISLNMQKALREYRDFHGTLPDRILFYRDGVGEGQLHQVVETEVKSLVKDLDGIYKSAGIEKGCRLAFIVVTKQINTRYFYQQDNPPPGTVVDDVITLPERYDFYLVSQSVRQGTVSPTGYNVIYDTVGLDADKIQILTYKFTHLYYNWSGTTRVPAVCQYAHKLAFLVGQSIHQSPQNLEKQLYYL